MKVKTAHYFTRREKNMFLIYNRIFFIFNETIQIPEDNDVVLKIYEKTENEIVC